MTDTPSAKGLLRETVCSNGVDRQLLQQHDNLTPIQYILSMAMLLHDPCISDIPIQSERPLRNFRVYLQ